MPAEQIENIYTLSPLQRGLLFHSLQGSADATYISQLRVDIDGLDVDRFKASWRGVVGRHEVLRTGFLHELDTPLQWVARNVTLPFSEVDLRDRPDQSSQLDELALSGLCRPFDLAAPPLMRFALALTQDGRHHFVWTHHHILTDGWSTSQVVGEVLHHYNGHALPVRVRAISRLHDVVAAVVSAGIGDVLEVFAPTARGTNSTD